MAYKIIDRTGELTSSLVPIKATYPMPHPIGVTVHNTANKASAQNEISYMLSNSNYTSYHVAIDDVHAVEAIPFTRAAWHAGDGAQGAGNRKTIGIEICYSTGDAGRFAQAEANAARYIAHVLHQYGWTLKNVYKHQDWSGKYCPHKTLDKGWGRFKGMIQAEYDKIGKEDDDPMARLTDAEVDFLKQMYKDSKDSTPSPWAKDAWKEGTEKGLVDGKRPKAPITRQEYVASRLREEKE